MRRILFLGEPFDSGIANNDSKIIKLISSMSVTKEFELDKVHPAALANAVSMEHKEELSEYFNVKVMVVDVKDEISLTSQQLLSFAMAGN